MGYPHRNTQARQALLARRRVRQHIRDADAATRHELAKERLREQQEVDDPRGIRTEGD